MAHNESTGDHGTILFIREVFYLLAFMDQLLSELPDSNQKEIHVILDNYCIHKRNNEWLAAHPNVTFHFTPTLQVGLIKWKYGLASFQEKP